MISIIWDPKARDFLRKLPKNISKRIFKKVDVEIKNNVERYLQTLIDREGYKIRVGDYMCKADCGDDTKVNYPCENTNQKCCKIRKVPPNGVGCNDDLISQSPFSDSASWVIAKIDNDLCSDGSNPTPTERTGVLGFLWECGDDTCEIEYLNMGGGLCYDVSQDKTCDEGVDFFTMTFTLKENAPTKCKSIDPQKTWCPAPLPFFGFFNIIAVVVVIGLFYFFIDKKK